MSSNQVNCKEEYLLVVSMAQRHRGLLPGVVSLPSLPRSLISDQSLMDNKNNQFLYSSVPNLYRYVTTPGPHKDMQCMGIIVTTL